MSKNPVRDACAQPHHCSREVRLSVLARSPLTRDLAPEQHRELDEYISAWSWGVGEAIMFAGDVIDGTYLVAAGRARITRPTAEGREATLDIAVPGDILGPVSTSPVEATTSCWAMETTCALYLPAADLAQVVDNYPSLALAIMRFQQQRLDRGFVQDSVRMDATVEQRVAEVLQYLADKLGETRPDGSLLLQARLNRDDIAGMAGTTLESASRVLGRFKRAGLIDSGRQWISVQDRGALEELSAL